jgi:hypothetical protein
MVDVDVDVEENDTASAVRATTTKVLREEDLAGPVMINTAIANSYSYGYSTG